MHQELVVVGRYQEALYERLRQWHAADGTVVVLLDRRKGSRRRRAQMRERDRRQGDRRQRSAFQALLHTAGFFAVTLAPLAQGSLGAAAEAL